MKIPLNCNDKVYHEVRDMNFSQIGPFLNRKAKEIDEYYKSRHGASVSQLRDFTKKLSATQQEHTALRIRIFLFLCFIFVSFFLSFFLFRLSFYIFFYFLFFFFLTSKDTNIAEKILNYTKEPGFRRRLDAEQCKFHNIIYYNLYSHLFIYL